MFQERFKLQRFHPMLIGFSDCTIGSYDKLPKVPLDFSLDLTREKLEKWMLHCYLLISNVTSAERFDRTHLVENFKVDVVLLFHIFTDSFNIVGLLTLEVVAREGKNLNFSIYLWVYLGSLSPQKMFRYFNTFVPDSIIDLQTCGHLEVQ